MSETSPHSIPGDLLTNVTPHMLAVTMLRQVMDEANGWRDAEPAVVAEAHAKLPMACEFYQLRIFLDLVKQRFGGGVSGLVESSLVSVTNLPGKNSGTIWFARCMTAMSLARALGPVEACLDNVKIGIDCQVADQVLILIDEPDEEKRAFRLVLAESLTYARVWAEAIFPQLVAKIEFDPVSVAFVKVETAYKGLTNRWRESPGCFERHLQRMEGNPLFPEDQRNPTDQDILLAKAKDDADLEKLVLDVKAFMSDFKNLIDQGQMQGPTITDLMQHRIEPLMVRAAEIGHLPPAPLHLETLKKLIESLLGSLNLTSTVVDTFKKDWQRRTNVFIAQEWRHDTPLSKECEGDPLLCESLEDIEKVLEICQELDPNLVAARRKLALIGLDIASSKEFRLPGAKEKLAIFLGNAGRISNSIDREQRPWWRFWRSATVPNGKDQ